jgi:hypothetical protein
MPRPRVPRFRLGVLLLSGQILAGLIWCYPAWQRVETVYAVVPVQRGPFVSMGRTSEVKEIRSESAGRAWRWSPPVAGVAWFGTEAEVRIDQRRETFEMGIVAALWLGALWFLMPRTVRRR